MVNKTEKALDDLYVVTRGVIKEYGYASLLNEYHVWKAIGYAYTMGATWFKCLDTVKCAVEDSQKGV